MGGPVPTMTPLRPEWCPLTEARHLSHTATVLDAKPGCSCALRAGDIAECPRASVPQLLGQRLFFLQARPGHLEAVGEDSVWGNLGLHHGQISTPWEKTSLFILSPESQVGAGATDGSAPIGQSISRMAAS